VSSLFSKDVGIRQHCLQALKHLRDKFEFVSTQFTDLTVRCSDVVAGIVSLISKPNDHELIASLLINELRKLPSTFPAFKLMAPLLQRVWEAPIDVYVQAISASAHPAPRKLPPEWSYLTTAICVIAHIATNESANTSPANSADSLDFSRFVDRSFEMFKVPPQQSDSQIQIVIVDAMAKDVRSTSLPVVFGKIQSFIQQLGDKLVLNDSTTVFFERIFRILSGVLRNCHANDYFQHLVSLNVSPILSFTFEYLNRSSPLNEQWILTRATLCEFVHLVIANRQYVNFPSEMIVRNECLAKLMEWVFVPEENSDTPEVQMQLFLVSAGLKAIAALMQELPLVVAGESSDKVPLNVCALD
jgi:hypothetical protein